MDKELLELIGGILDGMKRRTAEETGRIGTAADAPRVLAASEIPTFDGAMFLDYRKAEDWEREWALYKDEMYGGLRFQTSKWGVITLALEEYETDWRAWTGRPSKDRRMAEPWNKLPDMRADMEALREKAEDLKRILTKILDDALQEIGKTNVILREIDEAEGEEEPCED